MSDPDAGSPEGQNPFAGIPLFGDLLRMAGQQGPFSLETTVPLAISIANDGRAETNVDPLDRIRVEELARVAELHLDQIASRPDTPGALPPRIIAVNRSQWAQRTLTDYKSLFEHLSTSLGRMPASPDPADVSSDPFAMMLGPILKMITPMLLGMTSASMVGHLGRIALGSYHLPVPRAGAELMVVSPTLAHFAEEWSLELDDLRLWICLHELAHHAVLSVPHVRASLEALLAEYCAGFRPNPGALEERFAEIDFTPDTLADPSGAFSGLQKMFGDPEVVLGAIRSPEQAVVQARLETLVGTIVGWVDHVLDLVTPRVLGSANRLTEALRRRRVEASDADRFVEKLFGLELSQAFYDRGAAFIDGVVERGGEEALSPLWTQASAIPTAAEFAAPGLWLARLEFDA